jgi:hypothetical protein
MAVSRSTAAGISCATTIAAVIDRQIHPSRGRKGTVLPSRPDQCAGPDTIQFARYAAVVEQRVSHALHLRS